MKWKCKYAIASVTNDVKRWIEHNLLNFDINNLRMYELLIYKLQNKIHFLYAYYAYGYGSVNMLDSLGSFLIIFCSFI